MAMAALLAGGTGTSGAQEEPWRKIWLEVPVDGSGAVNTHRLLEIAHSICQGLGGRHYASGSSRLGKKVRSPMSEHGIARTVTAACTAKRESKGAQGGTGE